MGATLDKYRRAFTLSQELLDFLEIDSFPLDIFDVVESEGTPFIMLSTLSGYNKWEKQRAGENYKPLRLKDAKCFFYPDRKVYLIVYNETMPETRIRFTIAHELGHIVLGHLDDLRTEINRGGLDNPTYLHMEGEANAFAGNFLAPPILIYEWVNTHGGYWIDREIAKRFGLSETAVRDYRRYDYHLWLGTKKSPAEGNIYRRGKKSIHSYKCPNCKTVTSVEKALFCIICGCSLWGSSIPVPNEKEMCMKYPKIKLNTNGQVESCPVCSNEEILADGNYCIICKAPTKNVCLGEWIKDSMTPPYREACKESQKQVLPGNARYCPYCGAKTSFYEGKLLLDWEEELRRNSRSANADQEDLPF